LIGLAAIRAARVGRASTGQRVRFYASNSRTDSVISKLRLEPMNDTMITVWIAAGASLGGGLVCGLLSGAYQHWREWWIRPILEIDYQDDESHKVESNEHRPDGTVHSYIYVRVRVRNMGRRVAKCCRVFLSKLEEVHPSGQTTRTAFHDSRQLPWAGFRFGVAELPRGLDFYADIVRFSKQLPGWNISIEGGLFSSEDALKIYSGTYRFHLTVTADNADPATCAVDVTYAQDWKSVRAVALRSDF
jgi:hypothetical protein